MVVLCKVCKAQEKKILHTEEERTVYILIRDVLFLIRFFRKLRKMLRENMLYKICSNDCAVFMLK